MQPHTASRHALEPLFAPRSVALVAASDRAGALGARVMQNLLRASAAGDAPLPIIPINPKHREVAGRRCYPSLAAACADGIGPIDCAVIAAPAAAVRGVIEDAARAGIGHAIVLAAGFGETGPAGEKLQSELAREAKSHGVRLIGPNCLGVMRPDHGFDATFSRTAARPGSLALVSQSGAICTALVDWAAASNIGFSSVVSMGAAIDVDVGEILDYLLYDAATRSILLYLEGIRDARKFLSGLRAAARTKPIVIVKGGRHLAGSRAAHSHTGALVGADGVFDAVVRRCGVVRVQTYSELFAAARLLGHDRAPSGSRLAIVTNGGGPGVLAADAAIDAGVTLAALEPATIEALNRALPPHWPHANPVDVLGDAPADRMASAVREVAADPNVDGLLTLFCPQAVTEASDFARALLPILGETSKPILTAWLGESSVAAARDAIEAAGLPAFDSPEAAVGAFGALARHRRAQALLLEAPPARSAASLPDCDEGEAIVTDALAGGRTLLNEVESKQLLACYGITVPATVVAATRADAQAAADRLGYPVALKILSPDISHKSDVDGVRLNLRDALAVGQEFDALIEQVRTRRPEARITGVVVQPFVTKRFGRELIAGIARDPVFGPVLSFGAGGVAVERLRDSAIALPPLSLTLADELIDRTRIAPLLAAYRNVPAADRAAIVDVLMRLSDMAVALPWIAELDVNPLVVDAAGAIALDARVVLDPNAGPPDRRYTHMAIHPYPARFETVERIRDGSVIELRAIRPEDAPLELAFVEGLSDQTRYLRFFSPNHKVSAKMLARLTQVDYDRELALIALAEAEGTRHIVGVARYVTLPDGARCEFAIAVGDAWQNRGLGSVLMRRLIDAARDAGLAQMTGDVLAINQGMLHLVRALGFSTAASPDDAGVVVVTLSLQSERR